MDYFYYVASIDTGRTMFETDDICEAVIFCKNHPGSIAVAYENGYEQIIEQS